MPRITDHLAYLTEDLPGIGGIIKERPDDFLVEEQPLYQACGQGEHLYVYIEKREQTTSDVVRRLAKMFGVNRRDIGYAGLKDKHAITRQHFSVYRPDPTDDEKLLSRIEFTRFSLLWSARHTNKLRRGHLAGNRFVIRIRNVDATKVVQAKRILDRLCKMGAPNFLGDQRFGYRQDNHELGQKLLQRQWRSMLDQMLGSPHETDPPDRRAARQCYEHGEYEQALNHWGSRMRHERQALDALRQGKTPEQAVMSMEEMQLEFLISSLQSAVFNEVLDRRIRAGLFAKLVEGDLAWKHDSRAVFLVNAATAAADNAPGGRVEMLAVSPSGPMWGATLPKPAGEPAHWEADALAAFNLTDDDFADSPISVEGVRRPMRLIIKDPDVSGGGDEHGPFIRVAFELPRGSFATMVLREIMKPCVDAQRLYLDPKTPDAPGTTEDADGYMGED